MNKGGPVKVAMIGLGWWGKKTDRGAAEGKGRHRDRLRRGAEPSREEDFAQANGFSHYGSEMEALQHPGVEAVILARSAGICFTPKQITRAVAAGKHIFCEKPLALTRKEAEVAVDACAKNNRRARHWP